MSEENTQKSCDTDKKGCGCRKTKCALILSIVSIALNLLLIAALVAGARCHKKQTRGCCKPKGCPATMQCPMKSDQCPMGGKKNWQRGAGKQGVRPTRDFGARAGERGERLMEKLSADLSLTAEQQAKIKDIMAEQKERFTKLEQAAPGEFKKIIEDGHAKIRAVLKPDQQKKFDEMIAEAQARFDAMRARRR